MATHMGIEGLTNHSRVELSIQFEEKQRKDSFNSYIIWLHATFVLFPSLHLQHNPFLQISTSILSDLNPNPNPVWTVSQIGAGPPHHLRELRTILRGSVRAASPAPASDHPNHQHLHLLLHRAYGYGVEENERKCFWHLLRYLLCFSLWIISCFYVFNISKIDPIVILNQHFVPLFQFPFRSLSCSSILIMLLTYSYMHFILYYYISNIVFLIAFNICILFVTILYMHLIVSEKYKN